MLSVTIAHRPLPLRSAFSAGALGAILLLASGCTATTPGSAPAPIPTSTYVSDYVAPEPTTLTPLTGETVELGAHDNPSLAAKIDNHVAARPQVGLERTDIVFEELVEGGLTRYVAIWQSDLPDEIGPVRSIRPMDPDIVSAFGGIITYSGGQPQFVSLMQNAPVYNAVHGQAIHEDTFFRTPDKISPHNVIVRARKLVGQQSSLSAPKQQFAFAQGVGTSTAVIEGVATRQLSLAFSNASTPSWKWNAKSASWLRSQGGKADKDGNGDQLSAVNLVVLRVGVTTGLGVPKTELIGKGDAVIATGGFRINATWSKKSATSPIKLVDEQGIVIRLAPGNSWIELVPSAGSVKAE